MPKPKHRAALAADRLLAALIVIGWLFVPFWSAAWALDPGAGKSPEGSAKRELQLEVWINGYPANVITPFVELPDGRFETARSELEELDLKVPGAGRPTARVRLDTIPGLEYRYDQATQSIHLTVPDRQRKPKVYESASATAPVEAARADYGALINYSLYASALQGLSSQTQTGKYLGFNGVNASLDGRLVMPFGSFTQTGIVGTIPAYGYAAKNGLGDANGLRLESAFVHVDPGTFMTYRAGDTINGGLSWTQPIRMAGIQAQRNFTARPDIVTQALPSFSGSAAAPSSVDVFVNGVKTYSQQVAAGPFQLSNVPTIGGGGGGEARVVVRDASGKEVETKLPFYTAPTLLKPGMYETSLEAGIARYNYGITSNDYGSSPIGSASLRAGITDDVTIEAHAEGGVGLINGGVGAVTNVGSRAILSAALSGSVYDGNTGVQLYGSLDTQVGPVSVHASSSRAMGRYADLAIATARLRPSTPNETLTGTLPASLTQLTADFRPSVSRDQLTVSMPLDFDRSTISASYVRSEPDVGTVSQIVALSYARPFISNSTLFATAFANLDSNHNVGVYIGSSMPLGDASVSASINKTGKGVTAAVDASKPLGYEPGDWGWRVREAEGDQSNRSGAISYRSAQARIEAGVQQDDHTVRETAEAAGSIVAMGGNVYLANTIEDGFAVVNAGTPGVRVLSENRFIGETDASGRLLVPNLRSNQNNNISIDPTGLSINAEVEQSSKLVVPAYRSGVAVDFKVKPQGSSAILVLKQLNGKFVEVGSGLKIEATNESAVVGYEGQAFVRNLQGSNIAIVTQGNSQCRASFQFVPQTDTQVVIGPVVCE